VTLELRPLVDLLATWPGLVARPDPALVEDSLVLLPLLPRGAHVVDVGSGGGLPGLPLAMARSDLRVTLLEASQRKGAFLVQATAKLALRNTAVLRGRAEDAGRDPRHREQFDVATARAVAPFPVLAELCLPLVRVGGLMLAMKANADSEVSGASRALDLLGGRLVRLAETPSPSRDRGQVAVVEKVAPTPAAYPRRAGVPERRPLGI
jgi:16S rRNA (guanine527-N7)-methyltransferase